MTATTHDTIALMISRAAREDARSVIKWMQYLILEVFKPVTAVPAYFQTKRKQKKQRKKKERTASELTALDSNLI